MRFVVCKRYWKVGVSLCLATFSIAMTSAVTAPRTTPLIDKIMLQRDRRSYEMLFSQITVKNLKRTFAIAMLMVLQYLHM